MRNDTLIKTFIAPVAVNGYLVATFAAGAGEVELANAATDPLIGVTTQIGTEGNNRCDVVMAGITEVKAGAAVTKGAALTVDASGRVIASSQATDRIIGLAMGDAAQADDIISILVAQG